MIILEFIMYLFALIGKMAIGLVRFVYWLITARDCKHCRYGEARLYEYACRHPGNCEYGKNRCRSTICRCDFKKKNEKENKND